MKILLKSELNKVDPKYRKMVLDAWENNEDVPFGVTCLSSKQLTKKDLTIVKKVAKQYE